jgi:hypothetical protein
MRPLFRPDPLGPVQAYQTYEATARTRPATCRDVQCAAREKGWQTVVDVGSQLGQRQANYIRLRAGRAFTFAQDGDRVTFTFPPGQQCFRQHTLPVGALFVKRGGDWRAVTSEPVQMRTEDWIDDQQNTFDRIRTTAQRG